MPAPGMSALAVAVIPTGYYSAAQAHLQSPAHKTAPSIGRSPDLPRADGRVQASCVAMPKPNLELA
jgi:hypothetical protein